MGSSTDWRAFVPRTTGRVPPRMILRPSSLSGYKEIVMGQIVKGLSRAESYDVAAGRFPNPQKQRWGRHHTHSALNTTRSAARLSPPTSASSCLLAGRWVPLVATSRRCGQGRSIFA